MTRYPLPLSFIALLLALACVSRSGATAAASHGSRAARLDAVGSWGYQLQGTDDGPLDLARLRASPFDLLVIDHATQGRELTAREVATLKRKPNGQRRLVVAYLSIGEAETYRFYWRAWKGKPPAFVVAANPDWPDNHKVKYWEPAWQRILFGVRRGPSRSYLDRIIDAGFDGVYLDIVDAYEYFSPGGGGAARASAPTDMARLVVRLADYARSERKRRGFVVIPQNGPGILTRLDAPLRARYLAAVDALAAEDTFHFGDADEDNPLNVQRQTLAELQVFRRAGKPVLSVEYLTRRAWARAFARRARQLGFVPYVGRRSLDRLVPQDF